MSFQFETIDFIRFAPVALRQCSKKGYLHELKNGTESSKAFYCLFGNLLYAFATESDASSALGMLFLEACTCKIVNLDQPVLSITTVGGRSVTLVAGGSKEELQEWMDCIESSKMKNITRRLDDMESELLQSQHRGEEQERMRFNYESSMIELRKQIRELEEKQEELKQHIKGLDQEKDDVFRRLKSTDSERLLLLKSRGITPKNLPAWALHEIPRKGVSEPLKSIRMWTGTWNLSGKEPFAGMQKDRAKRLLQPFVPDGYDLYILGVQECPNENVYECLDALLSHEGCRRIKMEGMSVKDGDDLSDPSKIFGRGEGSLQSLKFTGIVAYCKMNLMGDIRVLTVSNFPFSTGKSKGAVAMVLSVFGRTVVFVNAHLEAKNNDLRRDQYQNLIIALGANLAESGFHLNEQFNHIIWIGDMNFSLVDTSGNLMPVETAVKLLEDGRVLRTLFETHDQLNQDKKSQLVFYQYREPCPFPNFYPTYKKIENRPPVNYANADWVKNTYRTQVKDSFFRGSASKERVPKFSDRILYFSMPDLAEDLVPEPLPSDMQVDVQTENGPSSSGSPSRGRKAGGEKTSKISVRVDNYRTVNDGEAMTASDHSPVFCTFLLRLRHDHGVLQQQAHATKSADINNLLSALGSNEQPDAAAGTTTRDSDELPSPPPPDNDNSEAPKTPPKRVWYTSNKQRRSSSPEKLRQSISPDNGLSLPKIEKMSLLPHGIYKIRISDIRLVWGMNEECPIHMSVLFPAPYEALAGERFVEYYSEDCNNEHANFGETYRHGSPSRRLPPSPTKTPQNQNTSNNPGVESCWRKASNSKTGTCIKLDIDRSPLLSCVEHRSTKDIPALVLTWKGDEPLDRLHICLKATTQAKTIRSPMARPKSINGMNNLNASSTSTPDVNGVTHIMDINNDPVMVDADEKITGHCSVALEQLCKVALAGTAGASISTSAARILVNRGRPMYNIDTKTLQREMVTLCCKLELEQV